MATYTLNTSQADVDAVVPQLTAKGHATMLAVGNGETSFFDDGIIEHSGIWGQCLVSELGHKSSGVINRLRDMGLWTVSEDNSNDSDDGMWWDLTALGADVANHLAGNLAAADTYGESLVQAEDEAANEAGVTVRTGSKWTYVYAADGSLVAEIRNDAFAAVGTFVTAQV